MDNERLIRCQNGHLFSKRRYGTVCPYCNIETAVREKPDEEKNNARSLHDMEPVCGWIVCISGSRRGKDYRIISGKNFVGRGDDMDIQILEDKKISLRNHSVIVYDPKKNETVLLPGDSNGIAYVNGTAVYVPIVLNSYDTIEMGESKFLFLNFCSKKFIWD